MTIYHDLIYIFLTVQTDLQFFVTYIGSNRRPSKTFSHNCACGMLYLWPQCKIDIRGSLRRCISTIFLGCDDDVTAPNRIWLGCYMYAGSPWVLVLVIGVYHEFCGQELNQRLSGNQHGM